MSLPAAVEEATLRVKRVRLSIDGRSGSEDSSSVKLKAIHQTLAAENRSSKG